MTRIIDWPRYSRWTWIVALLLGVLLVLLWSSGRGPGSAAACCGGSEIETPETKAIVPPAAMQDSATASAAVSAGAAADGGGAATASGSSSAEASTVPASAGSDSTSAALATESAAPRAPGDIRFARDGGKLVLEGVVPDPAAKDRLLHAALAAYGADKVVDKLGVDASRVASPCLGQLDALFARLKGEPAVGIDCAAGGIALGGTVPSEAAKSDLLQWARGFFGTDMAIIDRLGVPMQPVAKAEDVHCGGSIAAAVTFETGSARIDAAGRTLLAAIAACLGDGDYEIGGHTDNVGSPALNQPLSEKRAAAVRAWLVAKGVPAQHLSAVGYGSDHPIADNATAQGRAENRRIEFTKK